MSDRHWRPVLALANREFRSVVRTRTVLILAIAYALVVLTIAVGGSAGGGYLPLALDLLTPLEILVPALALAFGYRAVLDDRERGELAVLRTYPVSPWAIVWGALLGRATALLWTLLVPLVLAGVAVPLTRQETISVLASHTTTDSPLLYLRFVVFVGLFSLVALALALGISSVARSFRQGLALAATAGLVLVIGVDGSLVAGLGYLPTGLIGALVPLSPTSAFRGLVFRYVVGPAGSTGLETGVSPFVALLGFLLWTGGSVLLARYAVTRP